VIKATNFKILDSLTNPVKRGQWKRKIRICQRTKYWIKITNLWD